eukprot:Nk52_evm26s249 gene=Nk52_evmTU26s249
MTDTLKFGPEWLRSLSGQPGDMEAHDPAKRVYSKEFLLSLVDHEADMPKELPGVTEVYLPKSQCPLAHITMTAEEEQCHLSVNSIPGGSHVRGESAGGGLSGGGGGRGRGRGGGGVLGRMASSSPSTGAAAGLGGQAAASRGGGVSGVDKAYDASVRGPLPPNDGADRRQSWGVPRSSAVGSSQQQQQAGGGSGAGMRDSREARRSDSSNWRSEGSKPVIVGGSNSRNVVPTANSWKNSEADDMEGFQAALREPGTSGTNPQWNDDTVNGMQGTFDAMGNFTTDVSGEDVLKGLEEELEPDKSSSHGEARAGNFSGIVSEKEKASTSFSLADGEKVDDMFANDAVSESPVASQPLAEKERESSRSVEPPVVSPSSFDNDPSMKWLYKDPQGNVQGPFDRIEMLEWFNAGYFRMELLVKRACDNDFVPLGFLIKNLGRVPFADPRQEAAAPRIGTTEQPAMNVGDARSSSVENTPSVGGGVWAGQGGPQQSMDPEMQRHLYLQHQQLMAEQIQQQQQQQHQQYMRMVQQQQYEERLRQQHLHFMQQQYLMQQQLQKEQEALLVMQQKSAQGEQFSVNSTTTTNGEDAAPPTTEKEWNERKASTGSAPPQQSRASVEAVETHVQALTEEQVAAKESVWNVGKDQVQTSQHFERARKVSESSSVEWVSSTRDTSKASRKTRATKSSKPIEINSGPQRKVEAVKEEDQPRQPAKFTSSEAPWVKAKKEGKTDSGLDLQEIQRIEEENARREQALRAKQAAERRAMEARKEGDSGWSNPVSAPAKKSLLEIQMEQEQIEKERAERERKAREERNIPIIKSSTGEASGGWSAVAKKNVVHSAPPTLAEIQREQSSQYPAPSAATTVPKTSSWGGAWGNASRSTPSSGSSTGGWNTVPSSRGEAVVTRQERTKKEEPRMVERPAKKQPVNTESIWDVEDDTPKAFAMPKIAEPSVNLSKKQTGLASWVSSQLVNFNTDIDAESFVLFLENLENEDLMVSNINDTLGYSSQTSKFSRNYIRMRNSQPLEVDTNASEPAAGSATESKKSKRKKKKMQKLDPSSILGFSVQAGQTINRGEIDSAL